MGEFSRRFAALTPQQRELFARRLNQKGMGALLPTDPPDSVVTGSPSEAAERSGEAAAIGRGRATGRHMQFSIFFFSGDGSVTTEHKYRLIIESAKFADRHGFSAVWTPERHFQDFGGLYPNPSVLSGALAMVTEHIQIRAGSVALPLHHPVRVAEEWSVVDNLSNGRVAVSFASGWHPDDFIFAPNVYDNRKEVMFDYIETIQKLWCGESVTFAAMEGREVEVKILPIPLQPRLPIWITSAGSSKTWARAGEIGANVLTTLIGYTHNDLAELIALYRERRAKHGHEPKSGVVTLMLHTFLGDHDAAVKEKVRAPMCNYLRTYMKQQENVMIDPQSVTETDRESLVSFAFENYFDTSTLLGTVDKCARIVDKLIDIGVDEIACLVDFGLDLETVMGGLCYLNELRQQYHHEPKAKALEESF